VSTWIKLLDTFPEHPDVLDLTNTAFRAYVEALCYCSRNLTDGAMTDAAVRRLGIRPKVTAELVQAGLWSPTVAGFEVVNYTKHQRTKAQVEGEKASNRLRQQRHRAAADPSLPPPETPMSRRDTPVTNGDVTAPETETEADTPLTPLPEPCRDEPYGWAAKDPEVPTHIDDARRRLRSRTS
jgi:hypothetical protein